MAKTLEHFDQQAAELLDRVIETHHFRLRGLGARIKGIIGRKTDKEDNVVPYLKFAGEAALAVVRAISPSRKIFLQHDAEIEVDAARWDLMTNAQREALIDHELEHLTPALERDGAPKYDDHNHIVLKCRPHDFLVGGFNGVIERHGTNAFEYQAGRGIGESVEASLGRFQAAISRASSEVAATLSSGSSA